MKTSIDPAAEDRPAAAIGIEDRIERGDAFQELSAQAFFATWC